jgi:hypothetical protein
MALMGQVEPIGGRGKADAIILNFQQDVILGFHQEVSASGGPIDYRSASIGLFTSTVFFTIDSASSISRTANTAYTLTFPVN